MILIFLALRDAWSRPSTCCSITTATWRWHSVLDPVCSLLSCRPGPESRSSICTLHRWGGRSRDNPAEAWVYRPFAFDVHPTNMPSSRASSRRSGIACHSTLSDPACCLFRHVGGCRLERGIVKGSDACVERILAENKDRYVEGKPITGRP